MAEVLLIYPLNGGFQEYLRANRPLPLGLLSASAFVATEFDTAFLDQRTTPRFKQRLREELAKGPRCVAMSVMLGEQIAVALKLCRAIKAVSDVPVVWGGVHASLMPEETLRNENVDVVVRGDGEHTFLELVRALRDGRGLHGIPGVCFKESGRVVVNPERGFVDLNEMPPLPYHLLDVSDYNCSVHRPLRRGRINMQMESSRGCPHDCAFCYNPAYSKRRWRALSAEATLDRIEDMVTRFGMGGLDFVDDGFFTDLDRVREIAEGLLARGIDLEWFVQGARVDAVQQLSDQDLALLHRSGCRVMRFGVESGSARILDEMHKGIGVSDALALNRRLRGTGIAPWYYFTVGMPGETRQDLEQTVRMLFELLDENPEARIVATFCIVPMAGTALYDLAMELDPSQVPRRLEDWARIETDLFMPWFDEAHRRLVKAMFFSSMFIDKKAEDMSDSRAIRLFTRAYRPLARRRMRRLDFSFAPELRILEKGLGLWHFGV